MKDKNLLFKLNSFYFIIYGFMACYYPFITLYFTTKGLSYSQIGIALAVNSLVGVIVQPVWGYITDKYLDKRSSLLISIIISCIVVLLFALVKSWISILTVLTIFMIFLSPIASLADSYCYDLMEKNKAIQYGKVRLMGSVGYAIIALAMGIIIKKTNINSSFYIYFILSIIGFFLLKTVSFKGRSATYRINPNDLLVLIKNKKFFVFIVTVFFINISMGANGNYITILIQKTGGDVSNLGLLWFVVAISELPAFFFGNKLLMKVGDMNLYIICFILYILRYFLDSICQNYNAVILIQLMQGITFPLYLVAALNYINRIVPERMRTSGITLYSAIGAGLGSFVGNIGGGFLLQYSNVFFLYKILSFSSVISLAVSLVLKKIDKN
ncbi:MFS transporter [Clostridium aciditolerans]|uniref:MFS transporter n=1 Tax=Clostridium aciditolerans TaxID=339861 RepID=A0A934LZL1_9CLOT|nr:MFS transporter [Clostridium aciditolerans]MBI6871094.1 MFS transporter [Clostridium aciditolerans]